MSSTRMKELIVLEVSATNDYVKRAIYPRLPRGRKEKGLRWSSGLELGADPTISVLGGGSASANLEDDTENYDGARVGGHVLDGDEEDEEEIILFICKNRHSQSSDDVPVTPGFKG
jgi:hypothetical protein